MTKEELLRAVGQLEPELLEKTAQFMQLTERLNPVFAQEIAEDINDILDVTERLLSEHDEKIKTSGYRLDAIGSSLKYVGGVAGAGLGAALINTIGTDLYDAAKRKLTKAHNYNAIMRQNPELGQRYSNLDLQRSFDVLHRYAPEFTADPTLGAQLLRALAETAGTMGQFTTVKDLLSSRKTIIEAKTKQFQPRFSFSHSEESDTTTSNSKGETSKADRDTSRRETRIG